MISPLDLRS